MKIHINVWIIVILLAGFFLRNHHLDQVVVTNDEKISIAIANGLSLGYDTIPTANNELRVFESSIFAESNSLRAVASATIDDTGNAFIYYAGLHFWQKLTTPAARHLRFFSMLFGLSTILLLFNFLKNEVNVTKAVLTASLLTFHPVLIEFDTVIRGYSMAIFFSTAATISFYHLVTKAGSRFSIILYGALVGFSILTHALTFYVIIGHMIFLLFRPEKKLMIKKMIPSAGLAILIVGSWIITGQVLSSGSDSASGSGVTTSLFHLYDDIQRKQNVSENSSEHNSGENGATWPVSIRSEYAIISLGSYLSAMTGNSLELIGLKLSLKFILVVVLLGVLVFAIRRIRTAYPNELLLFLYITIGSLTSASVLALISGHMTSFDYYGFVIPSSTALIGILCARQFTIPEESDRMIRVILLVSILSIPLSSIGVVNNRNVPEGKLSDPYFHANSMIEHHGTGYDTIVLPTLYDAKLVSVYLSDKNRVMIIDGNTRGGIRVRNRPAKDRELMLMKGQYR